jgi:hypothetical protein
MSWICTTTLASEELMACPRCNEPMALMCMIQAGQRWGWKHAPIGPLWHRSAHKHELHSEAGHMHLLMDGDVRQLELKYVDVERKEDVYRCTNIGCQCGFTLSCKYINGYGTVHELTPTNLPYCILPALEHND